MNSREIKNFHTENRTHAVKKEYESFSITAQNAVNAPMDLKIYGQTVQTAKYIQAEGGSGQTVTIQGKNLIDEEKCYDHGNITFEDTEAAYALSVQADECGIAWDIEGFSVGDVISFQARVNIITNNDVANSVTLRVRNKTQSQWIHAGSNGGENNYSTIAIGEDKTLKLTAALTESNFADGDVLRFQVSKGELTSDGTTHTAISFLVYKNTVMLEKSDAVTDYEPFVPNSPSPEYPSPIIPSVAGGAYRVTLDDGIYECTLPDLYGIEGGASDKFIVDTLNKTAKIKKECALRSFTGTESNFKHWVYADIPRGFYFEISAPNQIPLCTHFVQATAYVANLEASVGISGGALYFRTTAWSTLDDFKAWVLQQYESGNPVQLLYASKSPEYTDISLIKVEASDCSEVPWTIYSDGSSTPPESLTPSADYPHSIYPSRSFTVLSESDAGSYTQTENHQLNAINVTGTDKEPDANLKIDGESYIADFIHISPRGTETKYKFIDETLIDTSLSIDRQLQAILSEPSITEAYGGSIMSFQGTCKIYTEDENELSVNPSPYLKAEILSVN